MLPRYYFTYHYITILTSITYVQSAITVKRAKNEESSSGSKKMVAVEIKAHVYYLG